MVRTPLNLRFSISTRLALWYGLSMVILLSVLVVFLYSSFHVGLHRDFQEQLLQARSGLLPVAVATPDGPAFARAEAVRSIEYQMKGEQGTYVRWLGPGGEIRYRSPNFQGRPSFQSVLPESPREMTYTHTWADEPARTLYTPVLKPDDGAGGWLEITRLEWSIHRELHRLEGLLGIVIVFGVIVAIASGYGLARRALRPVALLTEAANRIHAQHLDVRLPATVGVQDELTDLAGTFNAMLDRLHASFERERRFRADAAHELFTPLSAIQSEAEVVLRKARDPATYQETIGVILNHARRMSGIVDSLLQLSRLETQDRHDTAEAIDMGFAVVEQVRLHESSALVGGLNLETQFDSAIFARISASHLATIMGNLLDNAIKYTPAGGSIQVSIFADGDDAVIRVTDTGIGFEEALKDRLFDRFYRAGITGDGMVRGTGLGLSIVRALVEANGGTIQADSAGVGAGSTFEIRLPCAPRPTVDATIPSNKS